MKQLLTGLLQPSGSPVLVFQGERHKQGVDHRQLGDAGDEDALAVRVAAARMDRYTLEVEKDLDLAAAVSV